MTTPLIYRYDAVIFDLDGTLVNTKRFPLVASHLLFQRLKLTSEVRFQQFLNTLVTEYFHQIDAVAAGAPYKRPFDIIMESVGSGLRAVGLDPDDELLTTTAQDFARLHLELPEPYPGVAEMLATLDERGVRMGVVTNSFENHLEPILRRLDLIDYFEVLVDGGVVHTYKPNPRPFTYVIDNVCVTRESVLVVGDEFYADIVGAHNAGIDAIWINMRGGSLSEYLEKYGANTAPLAVVNSISEIMNLTQ